MTEPTVRRIYNALIGSDNIRYAVLPDGAASVTLTAKAVAWTYDAWAQIAASVGAVDGWLYYVAMENPSNPAAGYDVNIGSGAVASEVSLATVSFFNPVMPLPFPIRIAATTRVAGRTRSSTGVADTIAAKVGIIQGA